MTTTMLRLKSAVFSTIIAGLMSVSAGWAAGACDDFVFDPDPFDGDPMAWWIPGWGAGEWTPAPDGQGMDVLRTSQQANTNLCTQDVFSGDVTVWLRGSFRGCMQRNFGVTAHFDFSNIFGYSCMVSARNNLLNLKKWLGTNQNGEPHKVPLPASVSTNLADPDLILEIELRVCGDDVEGRVWNTNEPRPSAPLVTFQDAAYRTGQASISWGSSSCRGRVYEFCISSPTFVRGHSNADGKLNVADAIFTLSYLFAFGPAPTCLDAADANDDGAVDLADGIYILQNLFANGPEIPPPFLDCGVDRTVDELGCSSFPPCCEE
jgi:hypothetical protein